jgi:hypothetical protein
MARKNIGGSLVAGDQIEHRSRRLLVHVDVIASRPAGCARAHDRLVLERIIEALDPGALVTDADARRVVGAAEILKLGRVIERLRAIIEQRTHDGAGKDRADHGAVLGRDAIKIGCGPSAAGARLVLRYDRRTAGNEAVEMPRQHAGIDVVTAPDIPADEKINGLAGVEIRRRRRRCGQAGGQRRDGDDKTGARAHRPGEHSKLRRFLVPRVLLSFPEGSSRRNCRHF